MYAKLTNNTFLNACGTADVAHVELGSANPATPISADLTPRSALWSSMCLFRQQHTRPNDISTSIGAAQMLVCPMNTGP